MRRSSVVSRLVGLLAMLAALATSARPAAADDGRAALTLVPGDAVLVAAADLAAIKTARYWPPLRERVLAKAGMSGGFSAIESSGLDFERDVASAVIFARALEGEQVGIVMAGRFAAVELDKLEGATRRVRHQVAYYALDGDRAIALVGKHLVIASTAELEAVIDVHAGKARALGKRKGLRGMLGAVGVGGDGWLWADATKLTAASPLAGLRVIAAGGAIDPGLELRVVFGFVDDPAATAFEQQVTTMLAGMAGKEGAPGALARGLTMKRKATALSLSLTLDQASLDELAGLVGGMF